MKTITININEVLLDKLYKSLEIMDDNLDNAFLNFAENYILLAYQKLQNYINELKAGISADKIKERNTLSSSFKGISRISKWARYPNQYNHRIIKAFLQLEKEKSNVKLDELANRCQDKQNHPDVFVPTFSSNYAQMKFDEGKSHGKIFEDMHGIVTIWDKARDEIEKYRSFFE